MTPEKRNDCAEFEIKPHPHSCGDCQTDGHYLCANCKHIVSFEDMELSDNRMRYYPAQEQQREEQLIMLEIGEDGKWHSWKCRCGCLNRRSNTNCGRCGITPSITCMFYGDNNYHSPLGKQPYRHA